MFGKGRKTVDGVMALFHRTIEELHEVRDAHVDHAEERSAAAMLALQESARAKQEADRASKIIERMTEIVQ